MEALSDITGSSKRKHEANFPTTTGEHIDKKIDKKIKEEEAAEKLLSSPGCKHSLSGSDDEIVTEAGSSPAIEGTNNEAHIRVWSDNRQALCDSLTYFSSHQGGLYTKDRIPRGLLIGGSGIEDRDVFGAQVIITTMGGGRVRDANGSMQRVEDHNPNSKQLWMNAFKDDRPIMVIADSNHPHYPCDPGHRYTVLGAFHITDMWCEKSQKGYLVHKIRLEKVDLSEPSWWWPQSANVKAPSLGPAQPGDSHVGGATCPSCNQHSKVVYTAGWTCMHRECPGFFLFPNSPNLQALEYSPEFLMERTLYSGEHEVPPIVPPLPSPDAYGTDLVARKGIVCRKCGCCIRRKHWNGWQCPADGCGYALIGVIKGYPMAEIHREEMEQEKTNQRNRSKNIRDKSQGVTAEDDVTIKRASIIVQWTRFLGDYKVTSYTLPDPTGKVIGTISVFSASKSIREKPGGPDDLFREVESADLGLHRNAVRNKDKHIEVLTRHFQQNFGAPYKFGVSVASKPFATAPDAVLKALYRLRWAGRLAMGITANILAAASSDLLSPQTPLPEWFDFNEVLVLGYMEKDSITYHDDGEKGLGPTVATLSLGSPSTFSLRPKKKAGVPAHCGIGARGDAKSILEIKLAHGDMVVMHGEAIHQYYEHAVEPSSKRRFALTSRAILPEMIPDEEARQMGIVPEDADKFRYHGDLDANSEDGQALIYKQLYMLAGEDLADAWANTNTL